MSEQTANLCTTDACESLRARLAKYEDAEGNPKAQSRGVVDMTALAQLIRSIPNWHAMGAGVLAEEICSRLNSQSAGNSQNQCDGCRAGIPVENGMHRMGKPGGYADKMMCTARRYAASDGVVDERAAFEVCGVTVRRNEVDDWEYLSEGYGNDPDSWVACSDILGPFGGSGVDALLTAYAELQARAALTASAPSGQYHDLVWIAHQLADMVLRGDAPHTAVRVAKSLMRECEGKSSAPNHIPDVTKMVDGSAPNHSEQVREASAYAEKPAGSQGGDV